jgi:hypothetical protein
MPKESFPGLQRLPHFHRMLYMLIDLMSLCLYFGIEATMLQCRFPPDRPAQRSG